RRWEIIEHVIIKKNRSLKDRTKIRVLDAGCGDGNNLFGLKKIAKKLNLELSLFAIDYNPLRIKRVVGNKLSENICCASLLQLPFQEQLFDVIICNHVLEHIPEFMEALGELHRVLKKDGLLLLGVPNEGCFLGRLRNNYIQRSILRHTDHVNFFNSNTLVARAVESGFKVDKLFRFGFFTPYTYLHMMLMKIGFLRRLLFYIGEVFPSQCGDLQLMLLREK
ncbi:MAG: class I SAM-dependent methyltransferase, partial [Proteobacteria bacterium]|nr:class I SAM-dependent methyltransferase [Pseudomonadota bacterium]